MSRIGETFERLRERNEKGLVIYVTAGDPDLPRSRQLVLEAARRGADLIELGMPFSDPNADGPAIQEAMARARAAGVGLRAVLDLCAELRKETAVPLVLFGYYNPVFVRGCEKFAREAAEVGVDGVLMVDLPPEEAAELAEPLGRAGLDFIPLLAPTSTPERMARAAAVASGFVYYVSLTGVTGASLADMADVRRGVEALRGKVSLPVAVGFGVTRPEQAREIGTFADAVVVGTAVVAAAQNGGAAAAGELVAALKGALRG